MSVSMWNSEWSRSAACRDTDPDLLFVQGAAQNRVKVICAGCSVRTECLADALDNEIEFMARVANECPQRL
jgi:WhiB family redox-sensing transcriptional regulator